MRRPLESLLLITVAASLTLAALLLGGPDASLADEAADLKAQPRIFIDQQLTKQAIFRYIKSNFPTDYETIVGTFEKSIQAGDPVEAATTKMAEAAAVARRSHSDLVRKAPSAPLKQLHTSLVAFHRLLQNTEGDELCTTYARDGFKALTAAKKSGPYLAAINGQGLLLWNLFKLGSGPSVQRSEPTDDDWIAVVEGMTALGGHEGDIDIVAEERYDDPRYCSAFIIFIDAIGRAEGDSGDRLRAFFLTEYAKL